jgi:hypothetical protein
MDSIVKDQMGYWKDFARPQHLIPTVVGLLMAIAGVVTLFLCNRSNTEQDGAAVPLQRSDPPPSVNSPCNISGIALVIAGIITMMGVSVALMVKHPKAALEQYAFNRVFSR